MGGGVGMSNSDGARAEYEDRAYQCANCGRSIELAVGTCEECFVATEAEREAIRQKYREGSP